MGSATFLSGKAEHADTTRFHLKAKRLAATYDPKQVGVHFWQYQSCDIPF